MDSKLREKLEIRNFHSGIWERAFKERSRSITSGGGEGKGSTILALWDPTSKNKAKNRDFSWIFF